MKYMVGTKFHTYEIRAQGPDYTKPMYGEIMDIHRQKYKVNWVYNGVVGHLSDYTEEHIEDVISRFSSLRIEPKITPVELPDDLFNI